MLIFFTGLATYFKHKKGQRSSKSKQEDKGHSKFSILLWRIIGVGLDKDTHHAFHAIGEQVIEAVDLQDFYSAATLITGVIAASESSLR